MKLLSKTSYYYLLLSCILFLAGGFVFYYYVSGLLNEEINEQLEIEQQGILDYIQQYETLPPPSVVSQNAYVFIETHERVQERFMDTLLLSPLKDEHLPYRTLIFPVSVSDQYYTAFIKRPLIEKDDLLQSILKSLGFILLLLIGLLFLLNRWLSSNLWKPFYQTLKQLKETELNTKVIFPPIGTKEFNELHIELNRMLTRIHQQYLTLKEVTENASHELQTPLAIIRNNLETILQSTKLDGKDRIKVMETYESTTKLSRLYQSLLLLAKIENRQFSNIQSCSVNEIIDSRLDVFEELKAYKKISVKVNRNASPFIQMDSYLAEILVSNIVGNAFKYCPTEGEIIISINDHSLTVSNSGPPLPMDATFLFDRFFKGSQSNESSGLGLAIVRQICDTYNLNVSYSYTSPFHAFVIQF